MGFLRAEVSPEIDLGVYACHVKSDGVVSGDFYSFDVSCGSNFTQIKLIFYSLGSYRDFTAYFVYSDSNVSDGYYDWMVDSYEALRAVLMSMMHTTLTRVVT